MLVGRRLPFFFAANIHSALSAERKWFGFGLQKKKKRTQCDFIRMSFMCGDCLIQFSRNPANTKMLRYIVPASVNGIAFGRLDSHFVETELANYPGNKYGRSVSCCSKLQKKKTIILKCNVFCLAFFSDVLCCKAFVGRYSMRKI